MFFSILLTSYQTLSSPIECTSDKVSEKFVNAYCWTRSTFSVIESGTVIQHKYYQWVAFVLVFEALTFSFPSFLWQYFESGKVAKLISFSSSPIVSEESKKLHRQLLVNYLTTTLHSHIGYAFFFFFCEGLNLVNVIAQIYFLHLFLEEQFIEYGFRFWQRQTDIIFPKVAKCTIFNFGPSGTRQNYDCLCVLPLNLIYEKIFVFLWLWYVSLTIATVFALLYRLCIIVFPSLRQRLLLRFASPLLVKQIFQKLDIGDWFLFYQVAYAVEPVTFNLILQEVNRELNFGNLSSRLRRVST